MTRKSNLSSKNQIRPDDPTAEKKKREKKSRKRRFKLPKFEFQFIKSIGAILDGSFLTREYVIHLLPFIFFLVFIAMIYISNNYVAQERIRNIESLNKEIIELRNEHISVKSELMFYTKPSEISKQIKGTGIKEALEPPKKLIINSVESNTP